MSERILLAERLSYEWKLANSAKTAPKKIYHVNRNQLLNARILQLRHPSSFLLNSNQETANLLKTTFIGFIREDEGSTAVFQPRTETCMADPLTTELEVGLAQDYLNTHKGARPYGLFHKALKALSSHFVLGV